MDRNKLIKDVMETNIKTKAIINRTHTIIEDSEEFIKIHKAKMMELHKQSKIIDEKLNKSLSNLEIIFKSLSNHS